MNEVIVSLQQGLENMKTLVPTEAATPEQISKYFNENKVSQIVLTVVKLFLYVQTLNSLTVRIRHFIIEE